MVFQPSISDFCGSAAALCVALAVVACDRKPRETPGAQTPEPAGSAPAVSVQKKPLVPPREIWKEFSGAKALAEAERQIAIGPRPSGSAEIGKARLHIEEALRRSGWSVETQTFTDETPRGPIQFTNVIARYAASDAKPPATAQKAIVCSHYDTKRFSTIRFVGASDGASSTGALLELARVLSLDPTLAAKIELVFFDGEEAVSQFTETDGLYGSRYYAKKLRETGRAGQFLFGILWDMIGDKDLTITLPPDSPAELARDILAAAETLQLRSHFRYFDRTILDDHYPLNHFAKIPTINLIDFDYVYWHTADDTLDRISGESMEKVGAVTLLHLRNALKSPGS